MAGDDFVGADMARKFLKVDLTGYVVIPINKWGEMYNLEGYILCYLKEVEILKKP